MAKKAMKARGKKAARKVTPKERARVLGIAKLILKGNKPRVITTPRELIAAMGGPKAAEEALGGRVHRDAISMWGTSNRVPYIHQYKVDRWARLNGWLIHPKMFGEKQLLPGEEKLLKAA
jgi:predicted SpoU family rRNA methylase